MTLDDLDHDDDRAALEKAIARCLYTLEHQRHASPRWVAKERRRLLKLVYVRFHMQREGVVV